MAVGWRNETPIAHALGTAAQCALQSMGEFEVTEDNFHIFCNRITDQGILLMVDEKGNGHNLYEIAKDDYQEWLEIREEVLKPLIGFQWYWLPRGDRI